MNMLKTVLVLLAFFQINIGCSAQSSAPKSKTISSHDKTTKNYNYDPSTTEELRVRDGLPNFFRKLKARAEIAGGYTFFDEINVGKHTTTIKLVKLAPGITFQLGQFLVVK